MKPGQSYADFERITTRRYFVRELNAKGFTIPQIAKAILKSNSELFPSDTVSGTEKVVTRDLAWVKKELHREIFRGNLKNQFEERLIDYIDQQKEIYRQGLLQGKLDISMQASQNVARALGVNTNPPPGIVINNNTTTSISLGPQAAQEFSKSDPETKERIWQTIEERYSSADDRN